MVLTMGQRSLCITEYSPFVASGFWKHAYIPDTDFLLLARFQKGDELQILAKIDVNYCRGEIGLEKIASKGINSYAGPGREYRTYGGEGELILKGRCPFFRGKVNPSSTTDEIPGGQSEFLQDDPNQSIFPQQGPIQHLAQTLQSSLPTRERKSMYSLTGMITTWLKDNITYESGSAYSPTKVLQERAANCTGFSRLFVALSRALGIPSVPVVGFFGAKEKYTSPIYLPRADTAEELAQLQISYGMLGASLEAKMFGKKYAAEQALARAVEAQLACQRTDHTGRGELVIGGGDGPHMWALSLFPEGWKEIEPQNGRNWDHFNPDYHAYIIGRRRGGTTFPNMTLLEPGQKIHTRTLRTLDSTLSLGTHFLQRLKQGYKTTVGVRDSLRAWS